MPDPGIEHAEVFVAVDEQDRPRGKFVEFFGGSADFVGEAGGGWFE